MRVLTETIAATVACAAAGPAFAADGFIACEALATSYQGSFALHNVSKGGVNTAPTAFEAYDSWAKKHPPLRNQINAVRNTDATLIVARLQGKCTAFATVTAAQDHVRARMQTLSSNGHFNISTAWQPPTPPAPGAVAAGYVACAATAYNQGKPVAIYNVSRDNTDKVDAEATAYLAWSRSDAALATALAAQPFDTSSVLPSLEGRCDGFDTQASADAHMTAVREANVKQGYRPIATAWQPSPAATSAVVTKP